MGKRLLRKLQLQTTGRVPERRNLLLDEGDQGAGGPVASPLQHRQTALVAGLSPPAQEAWLAKSLGCGEVGSA